MEVQIRLYASLTRSLDEETKRRYAFSGHAGSSFALPLSQGATVADVIKQLGLENEHIHLTFVNGRARAMDYALAPDDELGLFPPVGGG